MDSERRIVVPDFYKDVLPLTDGEKALYERLSTITKRTASSLSSRWREPSLTIHTVEVSGPRSEMVHCLFLIRQQY
jgi:di- and tripeptidase